ncbi:MAG: methyltransferase domain-containing protein [Anaerolineae bacterium]|nr:methyltransferase domain-containing protein [Anaerolineae bacterium]
MTTDFRSAFNDAEAYEHYVGRWSKQVAHPFVQWLAVPPGQRWLDVGAGTGILTQVILDEASPAAVTGLDFSAEYSAFARRRVQDGRAEFKVGDATAISFDPPPFDAAAAGLVLNFVPSPEDMVQGMMRAVRDGGVIAAYVWDYAGGMEMMRQFWDAAAALDKAAAQEDSGPRFTICRPENLLALFQNAGLEAVTVIPLDVETRFRDFDDYWQPFYGAQGSVARYFRGLSDAMRDALRDQLRRQLPVEEDGSIPLRARAWAVKGRIPVSAYNHPNARAIR